VTNPVGTANIFGHQIHPMLIPFPIASSPQPSCATLRSGKLAIPLGHRCHLAAQRRSRDARAGRPVGKGPNPEPPYLLDTIGGWSSSELFWIIKNGIKMTGMASFGAVHKDDEIWNLVAFVQRLPKMTPEQ
jgi:Cytochrome C oxidase, cbb3-type, subunit III